MIEWVLNKKLHKNTELIKTFGNISHSLIGKKSMFPPEENQDLL